MIVTRDATRDEMLFEWVRSEAWRIPAGWLPADVETQLPGLVARFDPSAAADNQLRARILHARRQPILDTIPQDARYRIVRLEEGDLERTYLLMSWDWFLHTGSTFALTETLDHLRPGRGGLISGQLILGDHFNEVQRKLPYLQGYSTDSTDEVLVLVADSQAGPYTVIDGTHRAAALLAEHQEHPNLPWKAILIESPNMRTSLWHIGYQHARHTFDHLTHLVGTGHLW